VARRVLQALDRLAEMGHGDLVRLHGVGEELRLRVGDWRVRLVFEAETRTIRVFQISHRSEAYRG
jgi:mRNA-degrading endonuclease RelE of RelBE toxin-antitoxin system